MSDTDQTAAGVCFAKAISTTRWRRPRPRCARRRPISTRACCWPSCWPSPATSNAPMSCSTPPRRSIPSTALVVAEFRQLMRADMARRQLFRDGRVPEFLADPTAAQRLQLAALVALRAGDLAEATRQAEAAEAARPRAPGQARRCGVRRHARRRRPAGRQLRGADHDRQVFLDSHRARADAGVPPAEAAARPALAARVHVGRRRGRMARSICPPSTPPTSR